MKSFLAAIGFLTRIPVDAVDVTNAAGWFPLVGLLLGASDALVAFVLRGHLPPAVIAVLLVALDAVATGALHFDGFADAADGFGGGRTRDDVLRIMRDHAIGSYGGVALILLVALKTAAYANLLDHPAAIILTPALGRWSILLLTATLPYARQSASVIDGMGKRSLLWGTAIVVIALVCARSARGWIATATVLAVSAAFGFYCRRRINGITGDTLGANLQLCESAALITFLWAGQ